MMNREQILQFMKRIATLGSIGYLPASGTMATLVTWPVIMIIKMMIPVQFMSLLGLLILMSVTAFAWIIISGALQLLPMHTDPPQIVLDESVGLFWALIGMVGPISLQMSLLGVFLFRFFDIAKPFGIGWSERFRGAAGILVDDILAGIYTALVLRIIIALF